MGVLLQSSSFKANVGAPQLSSGSMVLDNIVFFGDLSSTGIVSGCSHIFNAIPGAQLASTCFATSGKTCRASCLSPGHSATGSLTCVANTFGTGTSTCPGGTCPAGQELLWTGCQTYLQNPVYIEVGAAIFLLVIAFLFVCARSVMKKAGRRAAQDAALREGLLANVHAQETAQLQDEHAVEVEELSGGWNIKDSEVVFVRQVCVDDGSGPRCVLSCTITHSQHTTHACELRRWPRARTAPCIWASGRCCRGRIKRWRSRR